MKLRTVLASCGLLGLAALPAPAASPGADAFVDWPAGASPREVGQRVAERFLASPHALWAERGTISYSEVCTWTGALDFAAATHDAKLVEKLAERFELFFDAEASLVPKPDHVDNSVFGALPLALYRETGHSRFRPFGLAFADQQ